MAACPACDTEIDVDEFDVEEGDALSCPECGANLEVTAVLPVALALAAYGEDGDEEYPEREGDDRERDDGEREDDADPDGGTGDE